MADLNAFEKSQDVETVDTNRKMALPSSVRDGSRTLTSRLTKSSPTLRSSQAVTLFPARQPLSSQSTASKA